MTDIWKKPFKDYFYSLPDNWKLHACQDISSLVDIKLIARYGWNMFQDKVKVRFQCSDCERSWTSVKGTVIFHYRLDRTQNKGKVNMWLLGQKCSVCEAKFEAAKWYDVEIVKCLRNLLTKVQEKFYDDSNRAINTSQRTANMSSEHRSELCQACAEGVCGLRLDTGNNVESAAYEEEYIYSDEGGADLEDYESEYTNWSNDDDNDNDEDQGDYDDGRREDDYYGESDASYSY